MTNPAKVMLSELEAMLVTNSEWILTKHSVMEKAGLLLAAQVPVINAAFTANLPGDLSELAGRPPKISKGERYRQLPYMILDYPAVFGKENVFALRTMFWWGNCISVTLHLSGTYKTMLQAVVEDNLMQGNDAFYISTGMQEWEHHFEADNYCPPDELNREGLHKKIVQPSFIKIALQYDLYKWDSMNELLHTAYQQFALLLKP